MNTVNFRCGHCGQLLAVQSQFLGQQVRCPHCQKVVVAPPPAAPPPVVPPTAPTEMDLPAPSAPAPSPPALDTTFQYTPPEEHESIFSAPSGSEDLFGQASAAKVDLPTQVMHPAPPPLPPPAPAPNQESPPAPPAPPPPQDDATLTYSPAESTQFRAGGDVTAALPPSMPPPEMPAWSPPESHEPEPVPGIPTDAAT